MGPPLKLQNFMFDAEFRIRMYVGGGLLSGLLEIRGSGSHFYTTSKQGLTLPLHDKILDVLGLC